MRDKKATVQRLSLRFMKLLNSKITKWFIKDDSENPLIKIFLSKIEKAFKTLFETKEDEKLQLSVVQQYEVPE